MKRLLDTSAYSAMRRGDAEARAVLAESSRLFLSHIVVGELLFGFRQGTRPQQNMERLRAFVEAPFVEHVPVTWETADRYARILQSLRGKGASIPTNDIWIAAHAFEVGAELVTADRHFERVEGLALVPLPS